MDRFLGWVDFTPMSTVAPRSPTANSKTNYWSLLGLLLPLTKSWVATACDNCTMTAELELVMTAWACASTFSSYICVCIPWTILVKLYIALWWSSGGAVHSRFFVPPQGIPLWLRWWLISFFHNGIDGKMYWNWTMSWGQWFFVSTLLYTR